MAFTIERTVDAGAAAKNHTWDVGGRFDFIFGEHRPFHSNGLWDNPLSSSSSDPFYKGRFSPENQADITQAYLDFALPLGNGLDLKVGKFVTPLGYEVINPTQNQFYSHSYLFGFAIPFTHTGILGDVCHQRQLDGRCGNQRGWNSSLRDNNGDPDLLGGVTWTPAGLHRRDKFIVNVSEGPQAFHDNHDWWTVIDFQAMHTFSPKLQRSGQCRLRRCAARTGLNVRAVVWSCRIRQVCHQ